MTFINSIGASVAKFIDKVENKVDDLFTKDTEEDSSLKSEVTSQSIDETDYDVVDEKSTPQVKTDFKSNEEVVAYLDADSDGQVSKEEMSSAIAKFEKAGTESVTINGKEYNLVLADGTDEPNNSLGCSNKSDLVLAVDVEEIKSEKSQDFIIAVGDNMDIDTSSSQLNGDDDIVYVFGNKNDIQTGNGKDDVNVYGNNNDISTGSGKDGVKVHGNNNNIDTDEWYKDYEDKVEVWGDGNKISTNGTLNTAKDKVIRHETEKTEVKALKTEFSSKKDFLEYFDLNPNNKDFSEKIEAAKKYLSDNNITSVTIDGEELNVVLEPTNGLGTEKNDLILSTNQQNLYGMGGNDFIIASNVVTADGDFDVPGMSDGSIVEDGDDTMIIQVKSTEKGDLNAYIQGGNGKDFIWTSVNGEGAYVAGDNGTDTIYGGTHWIKPTGDIFNYADTNEDWKKALKDLGPKS